MGGLVCCSGSMVEWKGTIFPAFHFGGKDSDVTSAVGTKVLCKTCLADYSTQYSHTYGVGLQTYQGLRTKGRWACDIKSHDSRRGQREHVIEE